VKIPSGNAVLSQGIIYLRVRGRSPWGRPNAGRAPSPINSGRRLLALGRWIMAVKIDALETVPPHVAIAAGLGGKAILLINGEFRAETHDARSATTSCMTAQSAWTS